MEGGGWYDSYLTIPKPHTPGVFILQVFKERIYLDSIRWKEGNVKGDISRYQMVQYERTVPRGTVQYERTVPRGYSMMVQYL